jgi:ankyrin repeat protein
MRAQTFSILGGLFLMASGPASAAAAGQPSAAQEAAAQQEIEARSAGQQQAQALALEIQARLDAGTATPEADAAAAAGRGDFGLMATVARFGHSSAPGAVCFTPYGQPARSRARYQYGDSIAEPQMRWFAYATAYNRTLIARADYPDADLCRLAAQGDDTRFDLDEHQATTAARTPSRPPRTLHEAARWGTAADVRRLLATGPIDAMDGVELTPLAWAVARDNRPAADALLEAGASPWVALDRVRGSWPVYLAAVLGRSEWFALLASRPGRSFERWSAFQVAAAVTGGHSGILVWMLREPHEPVRIDMLRTPLPPASLMEILLRDTPNGDSLLQRMTEIEGRADLVRLALTYHADPNRVPPSGQPTPLARAATGIGAESVEIVDLLLRAGADPNRMSDRYRPLWTAVRILKLNGRVDEIHARATAIFHRLLAGGADISLPDDLGRPPVWGLLFPKRYAPRELDARFVTPQLLELLVGSGLDLNARWEGRRMLPLVEEQAGRNAPIAVTLRRLGARR